MHFTLFLRMSGEIILIPWLRVSSRQLKDDVVSEVWILELSGLYPVTPGTGPRVMYATPCTYTLYTYKHWWREDCCRVGYGASERAGSTIVYRMRASGCTKYIYARVCIRRN